MTAIYTATSALFLTGFRALAIDLHAVGHEHIPATGPVLLASNHIGYLDFAFVMLAPPAPRREISFMARSEFFDIPVVGAVMRRLGQISIDVHGDPIAGTTQAQRVLAAGGVVGLHPEGTISPSFVPRRAKSGAIRLAESGDAAIVPVGIWGSQRILTKGRPVRLRRGIAVHVHYGEPFRPTGRTAMARSAELTERIRALVADAQRGYPQRPGPPPHDWWQPAHLGGSAPTPEEAERLLERQTAERRARREELA